MKMRDVQKELSDFRAAEASQIGEDLAQLKKERFNLRFQQATGQLEKTSRMREVRRMIARAKTVLREKSPKTKV
jgi:large subunit ribosomal protein L29